MPSISVKVRLDRKSTVNDPGGGHWLYKSGDERDPLISGLYMPRAELGSRPPQELTVTVEYERRLGF